MTNRELTLIWGRALANFPATPKETLALVDDVRRWRRLASLCRTEGGPLPDGLDAEIDSALEASE